MYSEIVTNHIGSVAEIVVSRPHERNTLRPNTLQALATALSEIENDPTVSGLLLRASGTTFLSGGVFTDEDSAEISASYKPAIGAVFEAWRARTFPVIAVVNGPALAFGCALALTADITVASPAATFTLPEFDNGLVPVYAIALMATRFDMQSIRDMVLTRRTLSAKAAATLGMVNELTSDPQSAETVVQGHIDLWNRIGRDVTAQAMRTFAAIEHATPAEARRIADHGLEQLHDRFRTKQSSQDYLQRF